MSTFADNMRGVASSLIAEFGNSILLTKETTTSGTYNPITDSYEGGTETNISETVSYTPSELSEGEINTEELSMVKKVITVAYSEVIEGIDNTWKADGNRIYKVSPTKTQDKDVTYKLYIG